MLKACLLAIQTFTEISFIRCGLATKLSSRNRIKFHRDLIA